MVSKLAVFYTIHMLKIFNIKVLL